MSKTQTTINVPAAGVGVIGPKLNEKGQFEQDKKIIHPNEARSRAQISYAAAKAIVAVYCGHYPEIGTVNDGEPTPFQVFDDLGMRRYPVPAFKKVFHGYRGGPGKEDEYKQYFHAGDAISYRNALRVFLKGPLGKGSSNVALLQVAPKKKKRPDIKAEHRRLIEALY